MCGHGRGRTGREGQMDLILMILAGTAAVLTVRAGAAQEGALRAAVNGVLGLFALLAVNLSSAHTGIHLGFNLFNGLTAGILGVPGVILLILVQWVLT